MYKLWNTRLTWQKIILAFWGDPQSVCGMCFSLNKPTSYRPKREIENYVDIAMNMLISHSAVPGTYKVYNKCLLNKQIDEWMSEHHFYLFWPHQSVCGIWVPWPGIEPTSSEVEVQSLNHWTTREIPTFDFTFHEALMKQFTLFIHEEYGKDFGLKNNN